jgi:hypothetical protein
VNDPATDSVFVNAIAFATDWSKTADVPPNVARQVRARRRREAAGVEHALADHRRVVAARRADRADEPSSCS